MDLEVARIREWTRIDRAEAWTALRNLAPGSLSTGLVLSLAQGVLWNLDDPRAVPAAMRGLSALTKAQLERAKAGERVDAQAEIVGYVARLLGEGAPETALAA